MKGSVDIKALKLQLFGLILEMNDPDLLSSMKGTLEMALSIMESKPVEGPLSQEEIDQRLLELEEGQTFTNAVLMRKIREAMKQVQHNSK